MGVVLAGHPALDVARFVVEMAAALAPVVPRPPDAWRGVAAVPVFDEATVPRLFGVAP